MKRTIISAIAACMLPLAAHAVPRLEMGIGATQFQDRGNMTWYQEGLPHTLQLNSPNVEIGFGDSFEYGRYGVAYHVAGVYMGNVKTDAVATPDDANYDPVAKACRGECIAHSNFSGRGSNFGVRATIEPYITYNGWRVGIEGGVYVSRNVWKMTVYDWRPNPADDLGHRTIRVDDKAGWMATPVVGITVGTGNFDVSYKHYWHKSNDTFPAIWRGMNTITLRYRF